MQRLNENASNEEIVSKINEIIDYIYKWQVSMLNDEIARLRYKNESDKFFAEQILPVLKPTLIMEDKECYTKNI